MREMNDAHRMGHKLSGPLERIELYAAEVKGVEGKDAWQDSEEIVAALEAASLAVDNAITILAAKPADYVARVSKPKVKMKPNVGAVVAVLAKFREDYEAIFDADEMNRLIVVVSVNERRRIFVRSPNDEGSKPIPMRPSEVRVVEGGEPA